MTEESNSNNKVKNDNGLKSLQLHGLQNLSRQMEKCDL